MVLTDMIEVFMTDYCYNEVIFYGSNEDIKNLLIFLGNENGGFSFINICPEPSDKDDEWDWYEWRNKNWSTKWDCWNVERELIINEFSHLYVKFCCPWNSPYKVIDTICYYFPDVYITMSETRENEIYKTSVIVRHPRFGWSNLYLKDQSENDDSEEIRSGQNFTYPFYKGYMNKVVYEEMIKVEGFPESLTLIRFRRNWFEKSTFL